MNKLHLRWPDKRLSKNRSVRSAETLQNWDDRRAVGEDLNSRATTCGNGVCDADAAEDCSTCPQDCTRDGGKPCRRVGMLYSVWHW